MLVNTEGVECLAAGIAPHAILVDALAHCALTEAVFVDNVYFLSKGATMAPTAALSPDAPTVPTGVPTYFPTSSSGDSSNKPTYEPTHIALALFPTLSPATSNQTSTVAPAFTTYPTPPSAVYYDGFKQESFP